MEIEEKYILECLKDNLNDLVHKQNNIHVDNSRYHHNCDYKHVSSILNNGILSIRELNNLNLTNFSKDDLRRLSDMESHINGIDFISLSVMGLDDLWRDEWEYDPTYPHSVDLLISSNISARRNASHYGNEFLAKNKIDPSMINSIDIRMLKLIKLYEHKFQEDKLTNKDIQSLVFKFNELKNIALSIKETNCDIILREMSFTNLEIDIDKALDIPKITLK